MDSFADIGAWISFNESLLSGLAAIIVVGGVIFTVFSGGFRRLVGARGDAAMNPTAQAVGREAPPAGNGVDSNPPGPITFKMLTAPSPHETKFADSDGVHIAYNDRGTGPPTIVCAPGIISHLNLTANLPATRETFARLSEFARILVFDKRGQGLSDPTISTPNLEERTKDIEAVMDDAGANRVVLMGVSEGGPMCLKFAHDHPDRIQGLILLGTTAKWVQSDDYPIGLPLHVMESLPRRWGRGVLRDLFFPSMTREQLDDDTYRSFERLISSREAIEQLIEMMIETDVRPLLPEIEVPALVIHFSGDLSVPIRMGRFVADHLPNAEFLEVNGVDHADLSQSAEAVERIREFCDRVTSDSVGGQAS